MKECSIANCKEPSHARNWCSTHYTRWRRSGDPSHQDLRLVSGIIKVPLETIQDPVKREQARASQIRFNRLTEILGLVD